MRKTLGCTVAALGLAVLGGALSPAQAATARHTTHRTAERAAAADQLTLAQLTDKVLEHVQAEYPTVTTLMLASGESPSGPTTDMAKVTRWDFVLNNSVAGAIGSVEVAADLDGTVSGIRTNAQRWGGVLPIDLPITLQPAEAYDILAGAGHAEAFQFVSLVKPLVPDARTQYHFSNVRGGSQGWAVDMNRPHEVRPILGSGLGSLEPGDC
ncbi:hypothetical protein [Streptacidiphilus albus]|uniref:hypothetical protein n=1 Tax=Streptacidiphilus albus TaxID=105425 RepID=UPI0006912486|nr:hypothetical protein [Streptacidiphilus albus]